MKAKKRAKYIHDAIVLVWASLDSHLEYTYRKHNDSKKHHKTCVKEYADIIKMLSRLY